MKCVQKIVLVCLFFFIYLKFANGYRHDKICRSCLENQDNTCDIKTCLCTSKEDEIHRRRNSLGRAPPTVHCRDVTSITFVWNTTRNTAYFLEVQRSRGPPMESMETSLTKCGSMTIPNLRPGTMYEVYLWSVSSNSNTFNRSTPLRASTRRPSDILLPVDRVYLENITFTQDKQPSALIKWTPGSDLSCYYNIYWFSRGYGEEEDEPNGQEEVINATHPHAISIPGLNFSYNYTIYIRAISQNHKGHQNESEKKNFSFFVPTCLEIYRNIELCRPEIPKNLTVEESLVDGNKKYYDVQVSWSKPKYPPHYYSVNLTNILSMQDGKSESTILNITGNFTEAAFKSIELGPEYIIKVLAWSNAGSSKRPAIKHRENTAYNQITAPEPPQNIIIVEDLVVRDYYNVKVTWSKPKLSPDYYLVHLVNHLSRGSVIGTNKSLNISGNSTEAIFKKIKLGRQYQITVVATNDAGSSEGAVKTRNVYNITAGWSYSEWVTLFSVLGGISVFLLFLIVALKHCLAIKKQRDEKRTQYCKQYNRPSSVRSVETEISVQYDTDEWEIEADKILIGDVAGQGAFGIVRNGYFNSDNDKKIQVAVKMLKDRHTQEQIKQFYDEIEIMKSVPKHPHLVSLIGVVTQERSNNPLLIVEYCAKGDLQSYLRNTWDSITSKFKLEHLEKCNLSETLGNHVSNKLYELDVSKLNSETRILRPKDLISIARQIVLGMEFLSNAKVIHRDLAARNVLVCENNTVKISDFGLSRDVYMNNVYLKTSEGKLPFRWMALESITHHRYTTKSDVWSFGILLWEIVTLGGTPYPGVNTQDLLPLLKSGYRMEKPINCSSEVYSLMDSCWKACPKDRPTFFDLRNSFDKLLENVSLYINLDFTPAKETIGYQNVKATSTFPYTNPFASKTPPPERYVKPLITHNNS